MGSRIVEERVEEVAQERREMYDSILKKGYRRYAEQKFGKAGLAAVCLHEKVPGLRASVEPSRALGLPELERKVYGEEQYGYVEQPLTRTAELAGVLGWESHEVIRKGLSLAYGGDSIQAMNRTINRMFADAPTTPVGAVARLLADAEKGLQEAGILPIEQEFTSTIGEDFEESWLHQEYETRREQERALAVVIVARDNETGTGKTTLAVQLAKKWADGWDAEERATNRSWEYRRMVQRAPAGSVLLADEIGQMYDSRRSMSEENVQVSQDWQMLRFRELVTLATLPGPSFLDKRLRQLADVLILTTRRGHGRVYKLKSEDMSGDPFREHKCNVEWGPLDDDPEYQRVEEMKAARFEERFGGGPDEEEVAEEELEEARREGRNETIRRLVEEGMTQTQIAEALGLDQSTISRIAKGE